MDPILIILLVGLLASVLILIIVLILLAITTIESSSFEKALKDEKLHTEIESYLFKYATDNKIPIYIGDEYFKDSHRDAAGYIQYLHKKYEHGLYSNEDFEIFLRKSTVGGFTTLAHELGHYRALSGLGDESEELANKFGADILKEILPYKLQQKAKPLIRCFLDKEFEPIKKEKENNDAIN